MPRNRRLELPGSIYHVIVRGIERRIIFKDENDRTEFIRRFSEALKKMSCKCHGWVLMPNHFHLVMQTGHTPLSDLMRKVLTGYAIYFNHRHKRSGYLYQNRYKSILCQEDTYLLELVRYVHLNPLRAGIVRDIEHLNRYRWSGHSVLIGKNKADFQTTDEVLGRFGNKRGEAIQRYIEFIRDGQKMGRRDDLMGGGLRRSAGGWSGVYDLMRSKEYWRGDDRILGDGNFVDEVLKISDEALERKEKLQREGWDIARLVKKVCAEMGIPEESIKKRGKGNSISHARNLVAYLASKELGISGSDLAKYFRIGRSSMSEAIARGEKIQREKGITVLPNSVP
ncbi:MAG: transposase [bacterium]